MPTSYEELLAVNKLYMGLKPLPSGAKIINRLVPGEVVEAVSAYIDHGDNHRTRGGVLRIWVWAYKQKLTAHFTQCLRILSAEPGKYERCHGDFCFFSFDPWKKGLIVMLDIYVDQNGGIILLH